MKGGQRVWRQSVLSMAAQCTMRLYTQTQEEDKGRKESEDT